MRTQKVKKKQRPESLFPAATTALEVALGYIERDSNSTSHDIEFSALNEKIFLSIINMLFTL